MILILADSSCLELGVQLILKEELVDESLNGSLVLVKLLIVVASSGRKNPYKVSSSLILKNSLHYNVSVLELCKLPESLFALLCFSKLLDHALKLLDWNWAIVVSCFLAAASPKCRGFRPE